MKRTALAMWQGDYKKGQGSITILNSGLIGVPFSRLSRFEGETAMSPEGLLAGAHAASFAMSLAQELEKKDLEAERIDTVATVKVEEIRGSQTITQVELELLVHAPSSNHIQILEAVNQAKIGCSLSRLIRAKITLKIKFRDTRSNAAA